MQSEQVTESFHLLGEEIRNFLSGKAREQGEWEKTLQLAEQENPWFTKENIIQALENISPWLYKSSLNKWLSSYSQIKNKKPSTIGVVMAGNIPLVGFHDFLCVLLSGNILHAKLSKSDSKFLPFLANKLLEIEPGWKEKIKFVEKLDTSILQAVVATGSNNTARHFEYYFRSVPHIIRKNRNGIAVLDGSETDDELNALGKDIFTYFGLGCRNVAKLYVPVDYDFSNFFRCIEPYKTVINHHKYHSNYVYNRTIYMMDGKKFTDNGFLIVINNPIIPSPIAVLNFEEYESIKNLAEQLNTLKEQIQCIVCRDTKFPVSISRAGFSETQSPSLYDYADGIDVMKFLCEY